MKSSVNKTIVNKEAKIGQQLKNLAQKINAIDQKTIAQSKLIVQKAKSAMNIGSVKNKEENSKNKNQYRAQFGALSEFDKYKRMVLNPFNNPGVRGPSKFFQPTSLLTYKLEYDFVPNSQNGVICVLPHCYYNYSSGGINSFAFFNANRDVIPGGTVNLVYSAGTATTPNAIFLHPLAGAGNVTLSPTDQSSASFTNSDKRFMTAKTNAVGIKIFSTGQNIARTGTLTLGILPGMSQSYNSNSIPIPSPQALRQYPTSYEINASGIPSTGTELIWLPLDPIDDTFLPGQARIANDDQAQEAYYRNQMWVLFNGIALSDTFRIEVVTHVEYVPTLPFGSWAPPESPSLDISYLSKFLMSVRNNLGEVINGDIGRELSGAMEVGRKIGQGLKLVSAIM